MKLKQFRLDRINKKHGPSVHYSSKQRALNAARALYNNGAGHWCQVIDLTQGFEIRIY